MWMMTMTMRLSSEDGDERLRLEYAGVIEDVSIMIHGIPTPSLCIAAIAIISIISSFARRERNKDCVD